MYALVALFFCRLTTGSVFGLGWLRDMVRIPDYVRCDATTPESARLFLPSRKTFGYRFACGGGFTVRQYDALPPHLFKTTEQI